MSTPLPVHRITELKQDRARLVNEARTLLDKAESEDRDLTTEESEQYDRIIHDVDQLGAKAEREERQVALEKELAEVAKPAPRLEVVPEEIRSTATTSFSSLFSARSSFTSSLVASRTVSPASCFLPASRKSLLQR